MRRPTGLLAVGPVALAAGVLAASVAGAPLYVSSAGSAAYGQQLAELCPSQTALALPIPNDANGVTAEGARVIDAIADGLVHVGPPIRTHFAMPRVQLASGFARGVTVVHIDGTEDELGLAPLAFGEIAVSDTNMTQLVATMGDVFVTEQGMSLTVAQRFTDVQPGAVPDFWCRWADLYELTPAGDAPAPSAIASPETILALAGGVFDEFQVERTPTTLSEGHATQAAFESGLTAWKAEYPDARHGGRVESTGTRDAVNRAQSLSDTVARTMAPVQLTALIAAAVVLISTAVLLARSRSQELRLMALRGVPPWRVALEAAGGVTVTIAIGAFVGLASVWSAVRFAGPSPLLEPHAVSGAINLVVASAVVAIGLVIGVIAWVGDRSVDSQARRQQARRLGLAIPVGLAVLAIVAYRQLASGGGVRIYGVEVRGGGLLAMGFPLFALLAIVAVVATLTAWASKRLTLTGSNWPRAVRLGWRRTIHDTVPLLAVIAAVGVAMGSFATGRALAEAGERQLSDKAEVYASADLAVTVFGGQVPDDLPEGWSGLSSLQLSVTGDVGDEPARLIGVDRASFASIARLRADASERSLDELMALIPPQDDGLDRAIFIGSEPPLADGETVGFVNDVSRIDTTFQVVATAPFFPGHTASGVTIVVDRSVVERLTDFPTRTLLVRDPPVDAIAQLQEAGVRVGAVRSVDTAFDGSAYSALKWSYVPLGALGVTFILVTLVMQLLVAAARAPSRRATHAIMRHTGFGRRRVFIAALMEIGLPLVGGASLGVAASLVSTRLAVPHLDPMPSLPPPAQFAVPWAALAAIAAVVVVWTLAVAGLVTRATVRLDPMAVLRGER